MHWHILGAGAMGSLLACKLQGWQVPFTLVCRDDRSAQSLSQGIELVEDSQTRLVPVPVTSVAAVAEIEALFIVTKANQAQAAFQQLKQRLQPGAPLVLLHNGMGVYEQIIREYPAEYVFCATTTEAAYRQSPHRVVHAGRGETRIGHCSNPQPPAWFTAFTRPGEGFIWEPQIARSLWRKLMINCAINPLTAIHRCKNGELLNNTLYRRQVSQVCAELAAVTERRGDPELANVIEELACSVMHSSAQNQSSMLQDLLHRRDTEIDYISGFLCGEAKRLQVAVPVNEGLWKQVRELTLTTRN